MDPDKTFAVNPGWAVLIAGLGIDPDNVLRRARLPGDLFSRGPTALSPDEYFDLWEALEEESADPNLPILIGRAISVEVFDPAIFAAICSQDLNVAAGRIAEHKALCGPMRLLVTQSATETTLEYGCPEGLQPPGSLAITELVFWVALARLATRVEVRPVRVSAEEPPKDVDAYREYLGVAVQKGPKQSVTFSAQDATRPFLIADKRMWEFFEPELRKRLSEIESTATTADRVRGALLELLPAGQASIEDVSMALGVPTRTLQRRLENEKTSFRSVLNKTRKDLALHYLRNSRMRGGEISFLLGFGDANSFFRAFNPNPPREGVGLAS